MVRSRCIFILSLAAFLAILFPLMGLCGGPCGPTGAEPQAANQQMPPGPAPAEAAAGGNFFASGAVGNVGVAGGNGASPWLTMSDLGLESVWGFSGRLRYDADFLAVPVSFIADYAWANLKGHTNNYEGLSVAGLPANGSEVDSKFDFSLLSFIADIDASPALNAVGYDYPLQVGPRLSYVVYGSSFSWEQVNPVGPSESKSRSFGMPGIGLWACLNLANLTGYGTMETSGGIISPKLRLSASVGKGEQMRYDMWDATLEVVSIPEKEAFDVTVPGLAFEIGYAYYRFDETLDRIDSAFATTRPANAAHSLDIFILRATAALPRLY